MSDSPSPQDLSLSTGGVVLCGACTASRTCRLGIVSERLDEDEVVRYALFCPADQEGGPGVAHGGWTAGALDEILGHVPLLHGQVAVTGTLTVRFIRPVPIRRALTAKAWVDRVEGKKWFVSGEVALASGAVLATATGIWVARDPTSHFAAFQEWLAAQEDDAST